MFQLKAFGGSRVAPARPFGIDALPGGRGVIGAVINCCTFPKSDRPIAVFSNVYKGWLRGGDLNPRPLGYEPNELPDCSTPRHLDRTNQR